MSFRSLGIMLLDTRVHIPVNRGTSRLCQKRRDGVSFTMENFPEIHSFASGPQSVGQLPISNLQPV